MRRWSPALLALTWIGACGADREDEGDGRSPGACHIDLQEEEEGFSYSYEAGDHPSDRLLATVAWYGGAVRLDIPLEPDREGGLVALVPHDNSASSKVQQRVQEAEGTLQMEVVLQASTGGVAQCGASLAGGMPFPRLDESGGDASFPPTDIAFDEGSLLDGLIERSFTDALDIRVLNKEASRSGQHHVVVRTSLTGDVLLPLLDVDDLCGFDSDGALPLNSAFIAGGALFAASESAVGLRTARICRLDLRGDVLSSVDTGDWPPPFADLWLHNRVFAAPAEGGALDLHSLAWSPCDDCEGAFSSASVRFPIDPERIWPIDTDDPAFFDASDFVTSRQSLYGNSAAAFRGYRADTYPIARDGGSSQDDAFVLVSDLFGNPLTAFVNEDAGPLMPGLSERWPELVVIKLDRMASGRPAISFPHDAVYWDADDGTGRLAVLSLRLNDRPAVVSIFRIGDDAVGELVCSYDTGMISNTKSSLIPLPSEDVPALIGAHLGPYPGDTFWLASDSDPEREACALVGRRTVLGAPSTLGGPSHAWTETVAPGELAGAPSGVAGPVRVTYDLDRLAPYFKALEAP